MRRSPCHADWRFVHMLRGRCRRQQYSADTSGGSCGSRDIGHRDVYRRRPRRDIAGNQPGQHGDVRRRQSRNLRQGSERQRGPPGYVGRERSVDRSHCGGGWCDHIGSTRRRHSNRFGHIQRPHGARHRHGVSGRDRASQGHDTLEPQRQFRARRPEARKGAACGLDRRRRRRSNQGTRTLFRR